MKRRMQRIGLIIFIGFLFIRPAVIKGAEIGTKESQEVIKGEKIESEELYLGDYLDTMLVGEKQLLNIEISSLNTKESEILYYSSNEKVATINRMGRIIAIKTGTTKIKVVVGKIEKTFELTVLEKQYDKVPVTDIELVEYKKELEVGKTITLSGAVLPLDASNGAISYNTSNVNIATVSSTGEVKGINQGKVIISLTAGEFTKNVSLVVKVPTTGIIMNKNYLILKPGEEYQLKGSVVPIEANQLLSYKGVDQSIVSISPGGLVKGQESGSTSIMVTNGNFISSVSVIVNKSINYEEMDSEDEEDLTEEKKYKNSIEVSEYSVIDSEMLKSFYERKEVLQIKGEGYTIEIDGEKIINYNNEFATDIFLNKGNGSLTFFLNGGGNLCGEVSLSIDDSKEKYLYLYNESREKYQQIKRLDSNQLKLTTAGKYMLTDNMLKVDMVMVVYIIIGGSVLLMIGLVVYIVSKKKYWFW